MTALATGRRWAFSLYMFFFVFGLAPFALRATKLPDHLATFVWSVCITALEATAISLLLTRPARD